MRAHLILNPEARSVTSAISRVIESALQARLDLSSTVTLGVDDGIEVARKAVDEGAEVIIACGGDGLVNEVVNGIAGSGATLAIIPGGAMNVFARNLGIPKDPLNATDHILQRLEEEHRMIPLGKADERYFAFACGCGFDAEAAMRVENNRNAKRRFGEPYFFGAAFLTFLSSSFRKKPFLHCESRQDSVDAVIVIALNGGPYAYIANRPVILGNAEDDIDVFVLERFRYIHLPLYAAGAWSTANFGPSARNVKGTVTVTSDEPFSIHVDGEPLPSTDQVTICRSDVSLKVLV